MSDVVARSVGFVVADTSLQVGRSCNGQIFISIFDKENRIAKIKMSKKTWEKIVKGVNSFEIDFARDQFSEMVSADEV